jgi:hypothetical protein
LFNHSIILCMINIRQDVIKTRQFCHEISLFLKRVP